MIEQVYRGLQNWGIQLTRPTEDLPAAASSLHLEIVDRIEQVLNELGHLQSLPTSERITDDFDAYTYFLQLLADFNNLLYGPVYPAGPKSPVFFIAMPDHLPTPPVPQQLLDLRFPFDTQSLRRILIPTFINWFESVRLVLEHEIQRQGGQNLHSALNSWLDTTNRILREYERRSREGLERLLGDVRSSAETAQKAAAESQQAAGLSGTSTLSEHFDALGESEGRSATKWTVTAIAFISASGIAAVALGLAYRDSSAASQALHLAWSLPLFAVAAYAARLANHHRVAARWARTAAVQVKSVPAFLNLLNDDSTRTSVLLGLSTRLFTAPDVTGDASTAQMSIVPSETLDAIQKIATNLTRPGG